MSTRLQTNQNLATLEFAYVYMYNVPLIRFAEYVKQIKKTLGQYTLSSIFLYYCLMFLLPGMLFFKCSSWANRSFAKLNDLIMCARQHDYSKM